MGLFLSNALTEVFDHGIVAITESRRLCHACAATLKKSRRLEQRTRDFLLAHPPQALRMICGGSDFADADKERPREVWLHRPTRHRWVVMTDTRGAPVSAVGPFAAKQWDPMLRDYVILDGHHSLVWLREHIQEFVRNEGAGPNLDC